jgi:hypothetical protein
MVSYITGRETKLAYPEELHMCRSTIKHEDQAIEIALTQMHPSFWGNTKPPDYPELGISHCGQDCSLYHEDESGS